MTFADYIEQFKRDLGLTNRDIADIMGVGPATFDNYLCGYVPPSQQAMSRLIKILAMRSEEDSESLVLPPEKLPFHAMSLEELRSRAAAEDGFSFRVEDDRLLSRGIRSGNVALIQKCAEPKDGGILLVSVDKADCRLMVFSKAGEYVRLYDDNCELVMSPSDFAARVQIVGRLTYTENIF